MAAPGSLPSGVFSAGGSGIDGQDSKMDSMPGSPASSSSSTSSASNGPIIKMKIKRSSVPGSCLTATSTAAPMSSGGNSLTTTSSSGPKKHKSKKHKSSNKRKDMSHSLPASPLSKGCGGNGGGSAATSPHPPGPPSFSFSGPAGGRLESLLKKAIQEPPSKRIKINGDVCSSGAVSNGGGVNCKKTDKMASNPGGPRQHPNHLNSESAEDEYEDDPPSSPESKTECPASPPKPSISSLCNPNERATMTEPDSLGPCEPGTAVKLQGIVWQETDKGLLVINVTWKGKTYMGTLLDCNRQMEEHKYGPPREAPALSRGRGRKARNCRSRTPPVKSGKGGGKMKGNYNGLQRSLFAIPASPLTREVGIMEKSVHSTAGVAPAPVTLTTAGVVASHSANKRRSFQEACYAIENSDSKDIDDGNDSDQDGEDSNNLDEGHSSSPEKDACCLIECPKPDCSKKFRDLEALKFHLSFAHNELKAAHDASQLEKKKLENEQAAAILAAPLGSCPVQASKVKKEEEDEDEQAALQNQDKENEEKKTTTIMASSSSSVAVATTTGTSSSTPQNITSKGHHQPQKPLLQSGGIGGGMNVVKSELTASSNPTNGFLGGSGHDGVLDLACKSKPKNGNGGQVGAIIPSQNGIDLSKSIASVGIPPVKSMLTGYSHQAVPAPHRVTTNSSSMNSSVMNGGSVGPLLNHNNSKAPSSPHTALAATKVPSPAYSDISDEENDTHSGSSNSLAATAPQNPSLLPSTLSKPPIQAPPGLTKPHLPSPSSSSSTSSLATKLNHAHSKPPGAGALGPINVRSEFNSGSKPTSQTIGPPLADISRGHPGLSGHPGHPGFPHSMGSRLPSHLMGPMGYPNPYAVFSAAGQPPPAHGSSAATAAALAAMSSASRIPQDILSRATSASQALDLLQQHAVAAGNPFLSASSKLQELQERAMNFPFSKASVINSLASVVNSQRMHPGSMAANSALTSRASMLLANSRSLPVTSHIAAPPKANPPFPSGAPSPLGMGGMPNFSLAGFPMSSAGNSAVTSSIASSLFQNTLHQLGGAAARGLPPFPPPNSSGQHPR